MRPNVFRFFLLILVFFSFLIFVRELFGVQPNNDNIGHENIKLTEHFEPSFSRLNSVATFVDYCDSVYGRTTINAGDTELYAKIVSQTLRDRFYHGYSYYSLGQNTMAYAFALLIKRDLSAIVLPNDILKHPMAACSQQSIIGMEVFKSKGFSVRKIGFYADKYGGHFCFEVFFEGKWHFFDPDMEPKLTIMVANHFPSIAEIVHNDSLLRKLYNRLDTQYTEKLFATYFYGRINKFPAPNARIYQYTTKYLSYTSWLFFVSLFVFVEKRRNYSETARSSELQDSMTPVIRA